MSSLKALYLLPSIAFIVCSCKEEPVEQKTLMPAALTTIVSVSTETEGLVNVSADAVHANYYTIAFYTESDSVIIETKDGTAEYQYTQTGSYKIVSRAHATADKFIMKTDSVEVRVKSSEGPKQGIPDINSGYSTPLSYDGYNLVWHDEFDGTSLNTSDWTYETGGHGWGNQELQYYRQENTEVKDGLVIITAKKESFGGRQYTSSRLKTQGKQSFTYGRMDIRAALPFGKGIWPAIWMLGESFTSVSWPACGEIDIMEMVGGNSGQYSNSKVYGTVHWEHNGDHADYGGSNRLSEGYFSDAFHVFSIEWDENEIRWYRDNMKFHTMDITGAQLSEFHEDFFFILNVAVGGQWPGSPNSETVFPQQMAVDYVRVFQKQ